MLLIPLTPEYICPTGYKKSPFLSKGDVSKKYRTIEFGITREMLLTKSQILSLPCLDPQEVQSLRETVSGGSREGPRGGGGGPASPLFLDQTGSQGPKKFFWRPPPPYPRVRMTGPPVISRSGSGIDRGDTPRGN